MFVLGIQGSPRKNGNNDHLLTMVLKACEAKGARTEVIRPGDLDISPAKNSLSVRKKGFCPIKDQMETFGYEKVRQADLVILASPVFFYGVSAQAKIFIDRCQMFWGRRYKLKLNDPKRYSRQGFLLSVGASAGKRLFDGVELTAKYFFDAISADYAGALLYRKVEDAGQILDKPELCQEIDAAISHLIDPMAQSKKVLFVSANGCYRGLMAAALTCDMSKGKIRAAAAKTGASAVPDPEMVRAMAQGCQLDLKYMRLVDLKTPLDGDEEWHHPDVTVFLGTDDERKAQGDLPENHRHWTIPHPGSLAQNGFETVREKLVSRIEALVEQLAIV